MIKIIISLIVGILFTIMVQGTLTINLVSACCSLAMGGLIYYIFFVQFAKNEVEILEEYTREPEDPEEILP